MDRNGSAFVTGNTWSLDFPATSGAFQTTHGEYSCGTDAFVVKLNALGNALVYSSYLGGSGCEEGKDIAIDASGNAYITGLTSSTAYSFPLANPYQADNGYSFENGNCGEDAFVSKVDASGGILLYSTFLGGGGCDSANSIAIDSSGSIHVTGNSSSPNFPTHNALQPNLGNQPNGVGDAFVTKFNSTGTSLTFSTYLGASSRDDGNGIAVDASGNVYVVGQSYDDFDGSPFFAGDQSGSGAFVVT